MTLWLGILLGIVVGFSLGLIVSDLSRWLGRMLTRSEREFHGDQFHQGKGQ